jgi:hypothetical protein
MPCSFLKNYLTADRQMTQAIERDNRCYDLDWLRTLAFLVLILYHIGMYYVADWGWHIKSQEQSVWLQNLMVLTNPWRMSLLFFVSAMVMSLVMQQAQFSVLTLAKLRSKRLLIPLVFSMFIVVPPQLFYELKQFYGFTDGYSEFMQHYLDLNTQLAVQKQSYIGLITWNHLWFLPYLWCYSMIILLSHQPLNSVCMVIAKNQVSPWLMFGFLLLGTAAIRLYLRGSFPTTHALIDDWFNHAHYFFVFVAGFILPRLGYLWLRIVDGRRALFILALMSYLWLLLDRHGWLNVGAELDKLWLIKFVHNILLSINHWAWLLALLGYAGRYLRFTNGFLGYANQAILPCYILHQSLIIILAVNLSKLALPIWIEVLLLIFLSSLACILGFEIIRRSRMLRLFFGVN